MSSTPNGPKGGDAGNRQGGSPARPALEQTFLGVAPPLNPPPAAANPAHDNPPPASPSPANPAAPNAPKPAAARDSAIVAAPMISLSAASARGVPAAPAPAAPAPQPAAPALAVTVPPVQLGGGWESANVMPRPGNPDRTLQHGTPRGLINASAQARAAFPQQPPRHSEPTPEPRPRDPGAYDPRATAAPQPVPRADLGAQHGTALASDYLRQARDAVLGARPPAEAARPQTSSLPPRGAAPTPQYPTPQYSALSADATAPSVVPGVIAAAGGFPATAELPAMAYTEPVPVPAAARQEGGFQPASPAAAPAAWEAAERFGTQASVAPPPLEADPVRLQPPPAVAASPVALSPMAPSLGGPAPVPAPAPMAAVAALPVQLHAPAPRSLAGTMLEPPPSVASAPSPRASSAPASASSRFEQVPAARVPLAEQGSSALQIPIDQSLADWNQTAAGKAGATHTQSARTKSAGGSQVRLIGLAVLALLAIGFVSFGDQLLGKNQKQHPARPRPSAGSADLGTVTAPSNPTSAALPSNGGSVSATTASLTAVPAPSPAATASLHTTAATPPTSASPDIAPAAANANEEPEAAPESAREKAAAAERNKTAEAHASPEELAAANAARNVITGRYAEALPLYQELARSYPQNTAYAAMVRVLKQKTETSAPAVPAK